MAGSNCFPKAARLRRRREFLRVQQAGRRQHGPHFVVIRAPGPGPRIRLGITVSARVGNAVERNRVKRLVREVFRQRRMMAILDIVVIAKAGAPELTFAGVSQELTAALGAAGIT